MHRKPSKIQRLFISLTIRGQALDKTFFRGDIVQIDKLEDIIYKFHRTKKLFYNNSSSLKK